MENLAKISTLSELIVDIPKDIKDHLKRQYDILDKNKNKNTEEEGASKDDHFQQILEAMKLPPKITTCRVNLLLSTVEEVLNELNHFLSRLSIEVGNENDEADGDSVDLRRGQGLSFDKVIFQAHRHDILHDVIEIRVAPEFSNVASLCKQMGIPKSIILHQDKDLFSKYPSRQKSAFPLDYKVIICDRMCGEAVLRGSNIFVRGVLAADRNVKSGDTVCVYAHVVIGQQPQYALTRAMNVEQYCGQCVFLGVGQTTCSRAEMFNQNHGLGVTMFNGIFKNKGSHSTACTVNEKFSTRAGPLCPPMNDILPNKMMLQNLPSILVGHILEPKPKDTIIDLCCAPGGKTSHVASLVNNDAIIIACDKSRKKMKTTKAFFEKMGATCVIPIAIDSTKCVLDDKQHQQWVSVKEILSSANASDGDGLLNVEGFHPSSFDRVVLDPPCSALGLRPKLCVEIKTLSHLDKHAQYQRKFVSCAVSLLKDGGTLVYSTCTINACENEKMVKYILDNFKCMKLVPIQINIGLKGLANCGLNDEERGMIRRFDPSDTADTMGFFIAKFQKCPI